MLGNVLADVSAFPVEDLPREESRQIDCSITVQVGGHAGNVCACLGRLSQRAALIGRVGDDDLGDTLVRVLEREGVNCSMVTADGMARTGVRLNLTGFSGARWRIVDGGANSNVTRYDVSFSLLGDARVFYACGAHMLPRLPPSDLANALAAAKELGLTTIVSPTLEPAGKWAEALRSILHHTDVMRPNEAEAKALAGVEDVAAAARAFLAMGCKAVVVTLGPGGHAVFQKEGEAVWSGTVKSRAKDRVGAGDAFDAGLITGMMQNLPLPECARWGAAVASFSVRGPNAFAAVPGIEAVRRALREAS